MKCPYRKEIMHQREYKSGYTTHWAKDIEEFSDCYENKCPFYFSGRCMRVEENLKGEENETD